jgi:predicted alpha/beta-fold hydrolase
MTMSSWPDVPPFQPPLWLRSAHAQTVAGAFWPGRLPTYQAEPRRVLLDDGDVIVVHDDRPANWQAGGTVAVLGHGLAGCYLSPYMIRIAARGTTATGTPRRRSTCTWPTTFLAIAGEDHASWSTTLP